MSIRIMHKDWRLVLYAFFLKLTALNPETPTQILRRMAKTLRKEIYKTQIDLAAYFPEKPIETAAIEEEIEYTKQLAAVLEGKLSYNTSQKLLNGVNELLDSDKIKSIQSENDEDASVGHKSIDNSFFGYKNHFAITDERLISGIEVTTGRASDGKNAELKQSHGLARCKYVGLFGMKMQIYFTAFVANVKRIVCFL